jgi:hypothetical protein
VLGLKGPVAAVEDHVLKEYAILAHRVFSHRSIQSSMPERTNRYAADPVSEKIRL